MILNKLLLILRDQQITAHLEMKATDIIMVRIVQELEVQIRSETQMEVDETLFKIKLEGVLTI